MEENQPLDTAIQPQQTLPNSVGVLVLGILSIAFCCCYGVGIVLGIISIIMANKAIRLYLISPESYSEGSYKNTKAGKVCAIIGLCLSSIYLVYIVVILSLSTSGVLEELIREISQQ